MKPIDCVRVPGFFSVCLCEGEGRKPPITFFILLPEAREEERERHRQHLGEVGKKRKEEEK